MPQSDVFAPPQEQIPEEGYLEMRTLIKLISIIFNSYAQITRFIHHNIYSILIFFYR